MSEQVASTEIVLTISSLSELLVKTIQKSFPKTILVDAEISNFKTYPSGHWYFSLSDKKATLNAVMFKGSNQLVRLKVKDGVKVRVSCEVNFYAPNGRLQLIVKKMAEQGLGDQKARFEVLKSKLIAEGLTSLDRKRAVPAFPRVIAVVTSSKGAVIQDILTVLQRRWPVAEVLLYSSSVQGDDAPSELLQALNRAISDSRSDVIIIGRGGGTVEDLSAFNDESLCRTIANSNIPVVSAVGHESDIGLTDLVADVRAATPSQAAEFVSPDAMTIRAHLLSLEQRFVSRYETKLSLAEQSLELNQFKLGEAIRKKTERMKNALEHIQMKIIPPSQLIMLKQFDIDNLKQRIDQYIATFMNAKKLQIDAFCKQLDVLSPLATLSRGYGIILKRERDTDRTIGSVKDVTAGSEIEICVRDGQIDATVQLVREDRK